MPMPISSDTVRNIVEITGLVVVGIALGISRWKGMKQSDDLLVSQGKLTELAMANQQVITADKEIDRLTTEAKKQELVIDEKNAELRRLRDELDNRPKPEAVKAMMTQAVEILAEPFRQMGEQFSLGQQETLTVMKALDITMNKILEWVAKEDGHIPPTAPSAKPRAKRANT